VKKAIRWALYALGFTAVAFAMWITRANAEDELPALPAQCNPEVCIVPREQLTAFVQAAKNTSDKLKEMQKKCWWRPA
jgi:hypothetical protein